MTQDKTCAVFKSYDFSDQTVSTCAVNYRENNRHNIGGINSDNGDGGTGITRYNSTRRVLIRPQNATVARHIRRRSRVAAARSPQPVVT
ncbi:hypothetical protein G5I_13539 [Acromyrmex echinatior]|uniref:Uncharacterized protein n=1 Tax=Acromyrmex echinatior TaxID=103372 RepID=F4X5B1_ACREC|nr:hypothetical protein G5I_13539 [Acromyrmex echinatior]